MAGLDVAAGVAGLVALSATILSTSYSYIHKVNDAPKELRILSRETELLSSVLFAVQEVATSFGDIDEDDFKTGARPVRLETLTKLQQAGSFKECFHMLEELQKIIDRYDRPMRWSARLRWPMTQREVKETLDKLARFRALFHDAIVAKTNNDVQQIQIQIEDLHNYLRAAVERSEIANTEIRKQLETIDNTMRKPKDDQILDWLTSTDPAIYHQKARNRHEPGTNQWLLDLKSFSDWLTQPPAFFQCAKRSQDAMDLDSPGENNTTHTDGRFIWLHGIPGSGKTLATSSVIEEVQNFCSLEGNERFRATYFYSSFTSNKALDPHNLVASLIKQIVMQMCATNVPQCVKTFYTQFNPKTGKERSFSDLVGLLHRVVDLNERTYIVLDVLRATKQRTQVLDMLLQLSRIPKVRMFVSTRKEKEIDDAFKGKTRICLKSVDVDRDVELYVRNKLRTDRKLQKHDAELKDKIVRKLTKDCQGMFQWVTWQMKTLCKARNVIAVHKCLAKLPTGLDNTYVEILRRIEKDDFRLARRALQFLTCNLRHLSLRELIDALATEWEDKEHVPGQRLTDPDDLLEICGPLINVIPDPKDPENPAVSLAHFSVKEFLLSERIKEIPDVREYSVNEQNAHREIARTCLTYISFRNFETGPCPDEQAFAARMRQFPFYSYASKWWPTHFNIGEAGGYAEELHGLGLLDTLHGRGQYVAWLQASAKQHSADPGYDFASINLKDTPIYHMARYQGVEPIYKMLLRNEEKVDAYLGFHGTALQHAVVKRNGNLAKMLLRKGANVNLAGGYYGSPLLAAIAKDNIPMIYLLSEFGVDFYAEVKDKPTPVAFALEKGNQDVVWVVNKLKERRTVMIEYVKPQEEINITEMVCDERSEGSNKRKHDYESDESDKENENISRSEHGSYKRPRVEEEGLHDSIDPDSG